MVLQFEQGDYEGLYESSKACLELFPTASTVYLLQGISANETEHYDDALEALSVGMEMIVNDRPMKAEFYGQIGEAYLGQGEQSAAIENYKKALEHDDRNYAIKNNYARRLAMMKRDLDLAESLANQINKAYPDQALFIDTKGMIQFARGEYSEAEKSFSNAMLLSPKDPVILEHLADAQAKKGNNEGAVQNWKLAKEYGSKSKTIDKKIAEKKYYAPEL